MKKPTSIRSELIIFCVVIVLMSMVCQIIFNVFFARKLTIHEKETQIEKLFTEISENYSDDIDVIYDIVGTSEAEENIKVHIVGEDGTVYSSGAPTRYTEVTSFEVVIPPEAPMDIMPRIETDQSTVKVEETIEYNGEYRTIILWSSVIAIDSSIDLFTFSNVIVSGFVILIAVCGVIIFSRRISRPIVEIEAVAKNVAAHDFSNVANENFGQDELRSLAISINQMSVSLSESIAQLENEKAQLSSKVEYQQQMESMRRQFIANISHEMKTPLSMLMMYSESLKNDIAGIDKNYYYDTIIEEAAGLNAVVEQLLDISSIENGLMHLSMQNINFSEFVNRTVDKISPLLEAYEFEKNIETDIFISGDDKYLAQAISNYLTNAIAHTQKGGKISAVLHSEGENVVFSVENEGEAISQEDMPYIWDSFYRGDKSRTKVGQKRVGLGLYIVKTCIEAHNGSVEAKNTEKSVVFSFKIPK